MCDLEVNGPVLCIDTTSVRIVVGVVERGEVASVQAETLPRGALDRVFPMIDATISVAGTSWPALERIIVCAGPGSFTGVRLGVAAARGFALSTGRPCVGVESAEVIAEAVAGGGGVVGDLAVCFGRPPRFAWRRYHLNNGRAVAIDAAFVMGDAEALSGVAASAVAGPAAEEAVLAGAEFAPVAAPLPSAVVASMAHLALRGRCVSPPAPIYLRPPDAAASASPPPVRLEGR